MLRKVTQLLDDSLAYVALNSLQYDNACVLSERIIALIRDISLNRIPERWPISRIKQQFESCFQGMGERSLAENLVRSFDIAARSVYRLEVLMNYPWEEETRTNIRKRHMCLVFYFYSKTQRTQFYKISFQFAISTGIAENTYWGWWPAGSTSTEEVCTGKIVSEPYHFDEIKNEPGVYRLQHHHSSEALVIKTDLSRLYVNDNVVIPYVEEGHNTRRFWKTDTPTPTEVVIVK